MSKAIGGYVRRSERRYVPPAPEAGTRGPDWLRYSVMPSGAVMCWRAEPPSFETPLLPTAFLPLGDFSEAAP